MTSDPNIEANIKAIADMTETLINQHIQKGVTTIGFLDYPVDYPEDEEQVRAWLYPQLTPIAKWLRHTAKLWSQPWAYQPIPVYAAALLDDLFRDGTMSRVYQEHKMWQQLNPYDSPHMPTPMTIRIPRIDWWNDPSYKHILETIRQSYQNDLRGGLTYGEP